MSFKEKLFYGLLVAVGLLTLGWAFLGPSGMREVWRMEEESARLREEVKVLEEKKDELARQAGRLNDDGRIIERRAREGLGMVREGETVIMIPGKKRNGD